jgi:glycosyltransferase involved in cell wall biosynthesis
MRPFISIGIPTYEMGGKGKEFLMELLNSIKIQSFKDFEVIISDHSKGNQIKKLITDSKYFFKVVYLKNEMMYGNPSNNINNIIETAKGEYIKFMFQDDLLNGKNSISSLVSEIKKNKKSNWFVSGSFQIKNQMKLNPMMPIYNHKMHIGYNSISSPSVLTIKNNSFKIKFNEEFKWLLDCVYYKDCYLKFGEPHIVNELLIINRISKTQLSNILTFKEKYFEILKSIRKYDKGLMKIYTFTEVSIKFSINLILAKINKL